MAVKTINSVRNALTVLEELAHAQPVGVSALARLVDLDKTTVHRVLLTLADAGWVRQADGSDWVLTSRALQVGAHYTSGLRDIAHPQLVELQRTTGETALLFAREHDTLVLVDSVDSEQALRMTVPLGTAVPILRTGAFDAFLPERDQLQPGPAPSSTSSLDTVRRQGWFVVDQMYPNSVAAGAPVTDGHGVVVAAIVVVGPKARIARATAKHIGSLAAAAARTVSLALNGADADIA